MLFRRIYVSQAAPGVGEQCIARILAQSRRNNQAAGLTGLLIFHEGRFFQVLEGRAPDVLACCARIAEDPRHTDMQILQEGRVTTRAFAGWKMGYGWPQALPDARCDGVIPLHDLVPPDSPARGADGQVRRAVRDFLAGFRHLPDAGGRVRA
ncbi:BLUF domain-containing protein [Roseovarius salinarum]|uniref:BLUF domain-containing protein n=1 Tax=Roseovarius salinarum TaxID=1981892 RepID=UPI000C343FA3|nr:BLUF domain-containing protein [Roseovarius salinarum]